MGVCGSAPKDEEGAPYAAGGTPPQQVSGNYSEVASNLALIPLLARLSPEELNQLAAAMQQRHYAQNETLVQEGDEGDSFYIIKTGTCTVLKWNSETHQNTPIAELREKDYCGENALLNNSKRGASIVSSSEGGTDVYTLDRNAFKQLFGEGAARKLNVAFGKRTAISAETGQGAGSALSPSPQARTLTRAPSGARQEKTAAEVTLITAGIADNLLFRNLSSTQRDEIVEAMWLTPVAEGDEIIKQGALGDLFYVVQEGKFDIFVQVAGQPADQEKKVASRGPGTSFGELALMYNAPRAASVRAVSPASVWCVDRSTFRRAITRVQNAKLVEYEEFLRGVHSFEVLLENERSRIAEALEECTFPAGHHICRQGEAGDALFIVRQGEVVVTRSPGPGQKRTELTRYHPGNFFGERALLKDEPRAATCTAVSDVVCLYLNREHFQQLLGPLEEIFRQRIAGYTGGAVAVSMSENRVAPAPTPSAKAAVAPHSENHLDASIRLADLRVIGTLGKGSFGHVQLVKHAQTGVTYALKTVAKQQVVQLGQQGHIISEKKTMAALNHPFLTRLHATFQSPDALYFVLEPVLGGELFSVLRTRTQFEESTARFYAAGVILAFEYMHERGIVYRDLKPENLLLDASGYLKVTDFGFAKQIFDARTWTLCGTPDYLAPEVVNGSGHGKGVDWWTLGILIYEMLASYPPFYADEPMKTYAMIMNAAPKWPLHFSRPAIDLLKQLLCARPTKRLGVTAGGASAIKNHAWFAGFDWKAFEGRTMKAPILMPIKSLEDLSNFEQYPDDDAPIPKYMGDKKNPGWEKDF